MTAISDAMATAIQHYQAGRLQVAEQAYRQILTVAPQHIGVLNMLGVISRQLGKPESAIDYLQQALRLKPDYADAHNNLGNALRDQGKLDEAIACYTRALALDPNYAAAHTGLGTALTKKGKLDEAVECYHKALKVRPGTVEIENNLANVLKAQGKLDEAVACYRRILKAKPEFAEAHLNLGNALKEQGKIDDAVACYRRALQLKPNFAEGYFHLGLALIGLEKLDEAVACCRRALELKPNNAETYNNLGNALLNQGKLDDAVACFGRAIELKPDYATAFCSLGNALKDQGRLDGAIACYRRAIELKPDFALAHNNLGNSFTHMGKVEDAVACYRRALDLNPDLAIAHNNLGMPLKDQGKLDEAIACFRHAVEVQPDFAEAGSNYVYTLVFCPEYDAQRLYEEHRRWNEQFAEPLAKFIQPHSNERSMSRRLRIGYVSPDFREHVVGFNLLPLFREHNRRQIEIICYSQVISPDANTNLFQGYSDAWRNIVGQSHEAVAQLVREDRIDILVDLTLHMANNRLPVFARRPAPVQVTFAGYPGTTGLSTIDYRLTDPFLDPADGDDRWYSEKSIRLPETFWCYDPASSEPEVNELPALEKGYVTFGCLNNFCKINASVLKLWAQVLNAVDRSRIMILALEGSHRQKTLDLLKQEDITSDRVIFVGKELRRQYLQLYHRIDLGLDTFPYNGHTTSLDSYWMGVPVITLVGPTVVGRAGVSQLSNIGLPELIVHAPDRFVEIAADLAKDKPRLSGLRASLRDRMRNSPLMDAPRFARNIEAVYRMMWHKWCVT